MCVCVSTNIRRVLQVVVTLPNFHPWSRTHVFWKNSKHSLLLSHLFSPSHTYFPEEYLTPS